MDKYFFYFLFFLILSLAAIDYRKSAKKQVGAQFYGILVILVAVATIRSIGFGNDDEAYIEIYKNISRENFAESLAAYQYTNYNVEFGFFLLLSIISFFGSHNFLVFGGVSFLAVYFNLRSIIGFTPYFVTSTLIYFSYYYFAKELNAIRAGLSAALLFYAALAIYEKKWLRLCVSWVAAFSIHVSAIFFVIPVFLYKIKPSRNHLIACAISAISFSLFFNTKDLIFHLINFGFIGEKLNLYLNAEMFSYKIPLMDVINLKNILILALSFVFWNKLIHSCDTFYISFIFFYSAALFRIIFGDFAIFAGRGYSTIAMFEFILLPIIFSTLFGKKMGLTFVVIYALAMLWMNFNINTAWSGGVEFFHDLQTIL